MGAELLTRKETIPVLCKLSHHLTAKPFFMQELKADFNLGPYIALDDIW
jgi:hypothetical protein